LPRASPRRKIVPKHTGNPENAGEGATQIESG
jgi:hypothetical protein